MTNATVSSSFATTHTRLAEYWNYKMNRGLSPSDVTAESDQTIWWKCPKADHHVWPATVVSIVRGHHKCPFCFQEWLRLRKDYLAVVHPQPAALWHQELNNLSPTQIRSCSEQIVWWKCPEAEDHVWQARVYNVIRRKHPCPYCAGRLLCKSNSLAMVAPQLAREWHPTMNAGLRPDDVISTARKPKAWWQCQIHSDHVWESSIASRTIRGNACPFCSVSKAALQIDYICLYQSSPLDGSQLNGSELNVAESTGSH